MEEYDTTRINVHVNEDADKRLRILAAEANISKAGYIERLIEEHLKENAQH